MNNVETTGLEILHLRDNPNTMNLQFDLCWSSDNLTLHSWGSHNSRLILIPDTVVNSKKIKKKCDFMYILIDFW